MNQTTLQKSCHFAGAKIQMDSNTDITMKPGKNNEKILTITGTLEQIQTAKILLKNTLKSDSRQRNSRNKPCNMKSNFKN